MHDPYTPCTTSPYACRSEVEAEERAEAEEAARVIPRAVVLTYTRDNWLIAEEKQFDLETGDYSESIEILAMPAPCELRYVKASASYAAERRGLPCYWIDPDGDGTPEEERDGWVKLHWIAQYPDDAAELAELEAAEEPTTPLAQRDDFGGLRPKERSMRQIDPKSLAKILRDHKGGDGHPRMGPAGDGTEDP